MTDSQFELLRSRRFLPLFVTQFLGAFNDNAFKNALIILVTFRGADALGLDAGIMVALAAGIFILPFFLCSATAGQLADKHEKAKLIRIIKFAEIVAMALAVVGLFRQDVWMLMGVLFLMGTQSAFFGPLKYAILPDHVARERLLAANGLIEAATFIAILLGTIAGGVLILLAQGTLYISVLVVGLAVLGFVASCFIPSAGPAIPDLAINPNFPAEIGNIIGHARTRREVFLSIMGISWFWLVGAVYLAELPTYAKDVLGANEHVVTLFLATFAIGIAVGSVLCNRALRGDISAKFVPVGAIAMTVFALDLVAASTGVPTPAGGAAMSIGHIITSFAGVRILVDLFLMALAGGFYTVPLYVILQAASSAEHRARNIAANNILNALFMVLGAGATIVLLALGSSVPDIFLYIAILNAAVAAYICKLLPREVVNAVARWILGLLYRVEVRGEANFRAAGNRVVIVANHTSYLDGALLCAYLPRTPTFAINSHVASKWWAKPAFLLFELLPLDPTNPMAAKTLVGAVKAGKRCLIFPEGRITTTGSLMKVYEGPGTIADLAGAKILPIRIEGAQYTPFSRLGDKLRLRWFPRITLTILEPRALEAPAELKGRARRRLLGEQLYDIMASMMFLTADTERTLFQALCDARAMHGGSKTVLEDVERIPVSYRRLILGALVLGRRLARSSKVGDHVALMLPNANGAVVAFFAFQAFGRIPAMLNYTAGVDNIRSACRAARAETVLTSRRFVELAKLEDVIAGLEAEAKVTYLEDIGAEISILDKLFGLAVRPVARFVAGLLSERATPSDPAAVLFTSGSEGKPKGVVLSHRNLLSNHYQLSARVDFNPTDKVFNALPLFHSVGLSSGLLLPVLSGVEVFLYPSPLHYRIVPELFYDTNATILFGTDTFLAGYARAAHPYDFYNLRHVFAGAEKLRAETRRAWAEKFGKRILEGYGATETSPVISTNTAMHYRAGTVGRLLPEIEAELEPVPGIEVGSRLFVSGPNVMLGYLREGGFGRIEAPHEGWYDTGDIVEIDSDGFITIVGRVKRFAKIGGEMVSLTQVEQRAAELWPETRHAAVALPDPRRGEQIILLTEQLDAERADIQAHMQGMGDAEITIPRAVVKLAELPLHGSGKVDYVTSETLAGAALAD